MKLTREAIQRMISQKQGTSNVTVINQEGGGGGGGVTLGTTGYPISISHDWHDDITQLTIIEL